MTDSRSAATSRRFGSPSLPPILCLPAFGDDSSAYEPLQATELMRHFSLVLTELPGFGGSTPLEGATTLHALAEYVDRLARQEGIRIVMAHSVASITASLAARRPASSVDTIVSLEGNLTPADAYHSGTAADYDDAAHFKESFLARLAEMEDTDPGIRRFRQAVARSDAKALWQLGCDARAFSETCIPGDVLLGSGRVTYLFDPRNMPAESLAWMKSQNIDATRLDGVSHWMTSENPAVTARAVVQALIGEA